MIHDALQTAALNSSVRDALQMHTICREWHAALTTNVQWRNYLRSHFACGEDFLNRCAVFDIRTLQSIALRLENIKKHDLILWDWLSENVLQNYAMDFPPLYARSFANDHRVEVVSSYRLLASRCGNTDIKISYENI